MVSFSGKRKTLASLAAELGVSATTVSNAYNRPEQLSKATRERILAAAAARGYAGPDPTARNLRTRSAGAVGVLLTEHLTYAFEDMASVDFLAGMAQASEDGATRLTLIPAGPGNAAPLADATSAAPAAPAAPNVNTPAQLVGQTAVDGFVVYSVAAEDEHLIAARQRGVPVVVCDQPKDTGLPFVGIDDRAAIGPAAQALIDAGHRRIGILAIRLFKRVVDGEVSAEQVRAADLHVQRARVLGALDVFTAAGLKEEEIPIVTRHINNAATAQEAAAQLLEAHPDLTAVLCTTDTMALGMLAHAEEQGLRVPEDISVTGFDGIAKALYLGLSTVVQPNKDKGAASGAMLARLIKAAEAEEDVTEDLVQLLSTRFEPGRTIAPPRG